MRTWLDYRILALGVASTVALLPLDARAATPLCSSLGAARIFVENGDTQEPLVKRLGKKLADSAQPLRVIYKNRRTCDLALDMYTPNKMVNDAIVIRYVPTSAEDPLWDPSKPAPTCDADPGGNDIDLGIGATFLSSCASLPAKPADLGAFDGPVQSYGFIVPKASSQIAITAEEAYLAFGFVDATGQASPWTDQALRFTRGPTASTALTLSAAIGLKASQLRGTVPAGNTSGEVLNLVATSASPEKTVGLMGTEVYDANRDKVKLLAFKAFKQRYAYFPDASATSFDKKNVRDGHYLPWAPTPYLARTGAGGGVINPDVQRLIELVLGSRVDADVNGLDQVIASGLVPACAMGVKRDFDGANLSLAAPAAPCTCYFESKVPQASRTCTACSNDTPCGGGKCRRGVCEAR